MVNERELIKTDRLFVEPLYSGLSHGPLNGPKRRPGVGAGCHFGIDTPIPTHQFHWKINIRIVCLVSIAGFIFNVTYRDLNAFDLWRSLVSAWAIS